MPRWAPNFFYLKKKPMTRFSESAVKKIKEEKRTRRHMLASASSCQCPPIARPAAGAKWLDLVQLFKF